MSLTTATKWVEKQARAEMVTLPPRPSATIDRTPTPVSPPTVLPGPEASALIAYDFDTPEDFLQLIRPHINYYDWQREISNHLSGYLIKGQPRQRPTSREPLLYNLVAANGSGKDAYVIAPFACWFACSKIKSRCIITSSSYDQLKNQTYKYIADMCQEFNDLTGEKVFDIVEFKITCLKTKSEIKLFVTDEAGKAEGYHPDPANRDTELAFIANEAKSINDALWTGFSRFTGYNYWLEISSPGAASGHFYKTSSDPNTIRSPDAPRLGARYVKFVSAYDCPEIPSVHIANMIYEHGEDSAFVKSSIKAEFTDIEAGNFIKAETITKCLLIKSPPKGTDIGIGMDIAAGGDEFTIYVRRGNEPIDRFFWRQRDTTISVDLADMHLDQYRDAHYIFNADAGGLGHPIIDALAQRGWRINRRNNQSPPIGQGATRIFGNLGAQMYHHTKRLFERNQIIVPDDDKTIQQLTSRAKKGNESAQGKFTLQSKIEARAQGHASPDRADAFVLCFFSYNNNPADKREEEIEAERVLISPEQLIRLYARGLPPIDKPMMSRGHHTILSGVLFEERGKQTINV